MVRRWLFTQTSFVGDPDATLGRCESDMPSLVREAFALPPDRPGSDGSFRMQAAGARGRGLVIDTVVEPVVREGERLRVPIRWTAASAPGPSFDGAFEIERVGDARLELSLYGEYAAGPDVSDPRGMLDVSEATGRTFLRTMAAVLGHDPDAGVRTRPPRLRVRDLMTPTPVVLSESDLLVREAARLLFDEDVSRLLVVEGERMAGIPSRRDVLKAMTRSPEEPPRTWSVTEVVR